jgi:hypothetical protein
VAETVYRNPVPPDCVDRDHPPRWVATRPEAAPGTVLWNVFLRSDSRLEDWRRRSSVYDIRGALLDQPPSLSGRGTATWFFLTPEAGGSQEALWAAGFSGPDGIWVSSRFGGSERAIHA